MPRNEKTKTIKFNMDKEEDRELWEWLEKRPHGMFSEMTKRVWRDAMEKNIQVDKHIAADKLRKGEWNEEDSK